MGATPISAREQGDDQQSVEPLALAGWCSALLPAARSDGQPRSAEQAGPSTRTIRAATGQADKSKGVRRTARKGRPPRLVDTIQVRKPEPLHRGPGEVDASDSHPALWSEALPGRLAGKLFERYPIRGRWFKQVEYGALRNAAWMVRNSRVGQGNNPMALRVVVVEVARLVESGEALPDVVEALCELLVHP